MGYGGYMKIVNNSSKTVTTNISKQDCMYDNGDEGSNLSFFNNLTINSFDTQPSGGGKGQYIEAKASGSCFFDNSTFTLTIKGLNPTVPNLNFVDPGDNWSCSGQPDNVNVDINNSGPQATIVITLSDPS